MTGTIDPLIKANSIKLIKKINRSGVIPVDLRPIFSIQSIKLMENIKYMQGNNYIVFVLFLIECMSKKVDS